METKAVGLSLIDKQGKLFGLINVIDFMIIICLLTLVPMFYYAERIINEIKEPLLTTTTYKIMLPCPNCGKSVSITIDKKTLLSDALPYKAICDNCECEVILELPKSKKDKPERKFKWPIRFSIDIF